ncbi:hypothetical protein D3C78_767470 [compost metagenome]
MVHDEAGARCQGNGSCCQNRNDGSEPALGCWSRSEILSIVSKACGCFKLSNVEQKIIILNRLSQRCNNAVEAVFFVFQGRQVGWNEVIAYNGNNDYN